MNVYVSLQNKAAALFMEYYYFMIITIPRLQKYVPKRKLTCVR